MKSKKIFYIRELVLNLPDDFNGDVLDALKILIEVREESEKDNKLTSIDTDTNSERDNLQELWNLDDKKCIMDRAFMIFNEETNEWEYR